ncbi:hypothetical protein L7F22_037302 [Adiantum nelumboides]|nr:hypothetical protein [Adiantum nelumboides]
MVPPFRPCVQLKAAIPLRRSLHPLKPIKYCRLHACLCQIHGSSESETASAHVKSSYYHLDSEQSTFFAKTHANAWGKHDFSQIASLLRCIGESNNLFRGKDVHAFLKRRSYDHNTYIGNCLIQMYGACGSVGDAQAAFNIIQTPNVHSHNILIHAYALNGHFNDARNVFECMSKRIVVSWTTIISSAVQQGFCADAMMLFHRMEGEGFAPNIVTFISILEACTTREEGCEVHHLLVMRGFEADTIAATALITMYGSCSSLTNAKYVFATMPQKNVVSWGAVITALTENTRPEEALKLFVQMSKQLVVSDKAIYICALKTCASFGALTQGRNVHMKMIEEGFEQDTIVGNVLITFYGKSDELDSAMIIFKKMRNRDAVSWTAIISACAQLGDSKEALNIFHLMKLEGFQPNIATHVSVLDACCELMALETGREVHLAVLKNGTDANTAVGNSLVYLYGKCGGLGEARCAFVRLQQQDVMSWNNIISACAQSGRGSEALENFHHMLYKGIEPNSMTFTFVMQACNRFAQGRRRDGALSTDVKNPDAVVGPFLDTTYGRWVGIGKATMVCEQNIVTPSPLVEVGTNIFSQLKVLGDRHEAQISLFNRACHQSGCTTGGSATGEDVMDHYTHLIDLLNHAGHLPEAEDLLKTIPNATFIIPWMSLLCSCRLHGDNYHGQHAADECFKLDPGNASLYFELTHFCTAAS